MLFVALPPHAFSQDVKVCIGAKVMYAADGMDGSTYEYLLEQSHAGSIIRTYNDSIVVQWNDTKGVFQLGVRETSVAGCMGDWAYLNVEIVGDYAKFTQPEYSFCADDGVTVDFNKADFRAYEWVDKTVPEDGHITRAGRYELRTIDRNGCLLSSFVDVIQNPMPKIYLGPDTMICTPGFTLNTIKTQDNPVETVYTWSTGASTRSIVVDERNMNRDYKYWVRAEYNGCVASDTITILACATEPLSDEVGIPNTFTPNADGDNDTWKISLLNDYHDCTVEVFDRWGRKVFTSNRGYTSPWDGRDAKGRYLPVETYYYIIHLNDGKTKKPIVGTITIIR